MNHAVLVEVAHGPVRRLLAAGGEGLVHLVALDDKGRTLAHVQLHLSEVVALVRALEELRDA